MISVSSVRSFGAHLRRRPRVVAGAALVLALGCASTAAVAGDPKSLLPWTTTDESAQTAPQGAEPWADLSTRPVEPQAQARDGYPNIGYDPSEGVAPLKSGEEEEAARERLRALSAANANRGGASRAPSFADRLRRLKDTHRADALRQIEGGS